MEVGDILYSMLKSVTDFPSMCNYFDQSFFKMESFCITQNVDCFSTNELALLFLHIQNDKITKV